MNDREKRSPGIYLLYYLYIKRISPAAIIKIFRKNKNDQEALIHYLKEFKNYRNEKLFTDSIGNRYPGSNKDVIRSQSSELDAIVELLERKDIKFVTIGDSVYPDVLKQIYTPPPVIFYKGNLDFLNNFCIAVVGSRKCTEYGREAARYIAGGLSENGISVVSGMALGIDSEAHNAALGARGSTIAVLGCGIDRVYPPENKDLFYNIVRRGLVLSEFFPGTPPYKKNFPVRNRIISGLCRGVVMVEAGRRSGAVITCDLALKQDREVFAVPGNIFKPSSRGCHSLIKSGAKLIEKIDDIIEEFSGLLKGKSIYCADQNRRVYKNPDKSKEYSSEVVLNKKDPDGCIKPELSKLENKVMANLGCRPTSFEKLAQITGLCPGSIMQALSGLELKDMVKACGPDSYCRSKI